MNTTTQFTTQFVNDLEWEGYFGEDAFASVRKDIWIKTMNLLGFHIGHEYDADDFDKAANVALTKVIGD